MNAVEQYVDVVRAAILAPDTVVPVPNIEPRSRTEARAVLQLLVSRGWTPPDPSNVPVDSPIEDETRFQEVLDHLNSPGEYRS